MPLPVRFSPADPETGLPPLRPAEDGLAGVTAADGRVLILMPHPERVFRTVQNAWSDPSWDEDGPWLRLFRNARRTLV